MGYKNKIVIPEYACKGKKEYTAKTKYFEKNDANYLIDENEYDYKTYLNVILKYSDIVCFVIEAGLGDKEALREDQRFYEIADSFLEVIYMNSNHTMIEESNGKLTPVIECVAYFKLDYWVRNFIIKRKSIYDFYHDFRDVRFIGDRKLICDTISHECMMSCSKKIAHELGIITDSSS